MSEAVNNQANDTMELSEILQVRRDKLAALQQEGRDPFQKTKFTRSAWSSEIKDDYDAFDGKTVSVAGRIMSKRGMGKAIFCHIKDDKGQIQLYIRADAVSEQEFADFRKYDIGDIVGVSGYVFKTKTEEVSVHVEKVELLSKSLRPLPEKFHGMTNTELKYRQRYVDLIVNDESRRNFEIRSASSAMSAAISTGAAIWRSRRLSSTPSPAARPPAPSSRTTIPLILICSSASRRSSTSSVSSSAALSAFMRSGASSATRAWTPATTRSSPPLSFYESYADFNDMMDLFEELLSGAAMEILGTYDVNWLDHDISLAPPFRRMTMAEAVKEYLGVDFMSITSDEEAVAAAKSVGVDMDKVEPTWGHALYECFDQKVEEKMIQPTFITMHPVDVSPLAKRSPLTRA